MERCSSGQGLDRYMVYPIGGGPAVFGTTGSTVRDIEVWTATLDDVEHWLAERVSPAPSPSKAAENKVRRAAARLGLRLQRPRRRDRLARDYATYLLIDSAGTARLDAPATLDVIEARVAGMIFIDQLAPQTMEGAPAVRLRKDRG